MFNRLANAHNKFQDLIAFPRTLVVCSAGMLRSPSISWVVGNDPYNRNSRAAGCVDEYALIPVDQVLLEWADEIICAEDDHKDMVKVMMKEFEIENKPIYSLNIPDSFKEKLEEVEFPKYKGT